MVTDPAGTGVWTARVMTLFPEMFPGPLGLSLAGKALDAGLWRLKTVPIRDYAADKHRTVDDTPSGGGPGMVMKADVLGRCIDAVLEDPAAQAQPLVYLSPRGARFNQKMAQNWSQAGGVSLLCGRYEGIDQRVLDARKIEEVSLGDFVLSGGEPAALVMLDAVVRLLPGVMGAAATLDEESFSSGLLEYPQFTRPQIWEGREIPEVLTNGNHEKIQQWRRAQAEALTKERRPDLWAAYLAAR